MTALYVLASVGAFMSGVAALGQLVTRFHLQKLRKEVNGQTQVLVATTHALGVAEGVAQQLATNGNAHSEAPA